MRSGRGWLRHVARLVAEVGVCPPRAGGPAEHAEKRVRNRVQRRVVDVCGEQVGYDLDDLPRHAPDEADGRAHGERPATRVDEPGAVKVGDLPARARRASHVKKCARLSKKIPS